MRKIDRLTVKYHGETVGTISLTPDDKRLAFEYNPHWIAEGFCISPLELPLKSGLFLAKHTPFNGNFGIFEDSLPDDYGRYLLHKTLLQEGVNDFHLSAIDTTRRFDLTNDGERIHTATAGGLLCLSLSAPVLDYTNLLALTGYLTQSSKYVEEMFRRMVFNYLTDNKDDHCKNFSFLIRKAAENGKYIWHLAPAYDLTLCTEGYNGQHATSVNGTGRPTLPDFIAVGTKIKMSKKRCREIFDEVYQNCGDLLLNKNIL